MKETRREFLRKAGCGLTMTAMATQLQHFGMLNTMAQKTRGKVGGAIPGDHRALVCIFLFGGNDGGHDGRAEGAADHADIGVHADGDAGLAGRSALHDDAGHGRISDAEANAEDAREQRKLP